MSLIDEKSSIIELYKEKSGPKMSLISSIKLDESLLKSNDGGRESLIVKAIILTYLNFKRENLEKKQAPYLIHWSFLTERSKERKRKFWSSRLFLEQENHSAKELSLQMPRERLPL